MSFSKTNLDIQIDEDLYSRQLAVTGREAMKKMSVSTVLIVGLQDGVGTEIAKNLSFKGVKNLILHDSQMANLTDLESGCFYTEKDIGELRTEILTKKIKQLNPYVNVVGVPKLQITEEYLKEIDVLIIHPETFNQAIKINKLCRKTNTKFIMVRIHGFSGLIFNDFGENHIVYDNDGEKTEPFQLESIDENGLVKCNKSLHNLQSGHFVKFTNIEAENMGQLYSKPEWKVKVKTASSFELVGWENQKHLFHNGTCQRVKKSFEMNFNTLENQLEQPNLNLDFTNPDYPQKNLDAWIHLDSGMSQMFPWSPIIKTICKNDSFLTNFYNCSKFNHVSVHSIFGGLVAEEAYKAITGNTTPMNQWFSWCDFSMIPKNKPDDVSNKNSITQLYGDKFFNKISNLNIFMVGSGAIGCELLKNFALMGVATSHDGSVVVTDPDTIEKSNLNRQFLFRPENVGQSKSIVAAQAVRNMRPKFNVTGCTHKVCPDNEHIYNEEFYSEHIDLVANALDNMKARLYVDKQCVKWGLPLLESGTMGTKGNTQVVIPNMTQSYGSTADSPESNEIPVCTLKNFPNRIEHTIHWAMDEFSGLFGMLPSDINNYLDDNKFYNKLEPIEKNRALYNLNTFFKKHHPINWKNIVSWASERFYHQYRNRILQLLHSFPDTYINKDGSKFWSAGKRKPQALVFDGYNDHHVEYIYSFTRLMGNVCNLNNPPSRKDVVKMMLSIQVDEFNPDSSINASSNDEEEKTNKNSFDSFSEQEELKDTFVQDKLSVQEFEKDDDSNWHISFVCACSNLRALNYSIPPIDFLKTKLIAGRIIPAISTTTSIVSGFISMELYKLYMKDMTIEDYKSYFVNIADNTCLPSEPLPPIKNKVGEHEMTIWDKFEYTYDSTLEQFKKYWEEKFNVDISMILFGSSILWSSFFGGQLNQDRISDIIKSKYNKNIYNESLEIILGTMDDNELPPINLRVKSSDYKFKLEIDGEIWYLNQDELNKSNLWKKQQIEKNIPHVKLNSIKQNEIKNTFENYLKIIRLQIKDNIDFNNLSKPINNSDFDKINHTATVNFLSNISTNELKNLLEFSNYLDSEEISELASAYFALKFIRNKDFDSLNKTIFT